MTDGQWKTTFVIGGLYLLFPNFVIVCFVLMIMYISASNGTGCVKKR